MSGGFLDATQSGTIGSGLGSSSTGAQGSAPVSSNVCPSCGSTEIDVDRCDTLIEYFQAKCFVLNCLSGLEIF